MQILGMLAVAAALGKPGDDYPVTHARYHKSLRIVSDYGTAQKPRFNI